MSSVHPVRSAARSNLSQKIPNLTTLIWRSLTGFRALHFALAAGIAAATAVIIGALVVGDSVRGSLKALVIERLGHIQSAMVSQRFFDPAMLAGGTKGLGPIEYQLVPLIVLPSSAVEIQGTGIQGTGIQGTGGMQRAQVQVLGTPQEFWQHASTSDALKNVQLAPDEVALNSALADELGARVGDEVTIRLPKGSGVPADSPLGRRDDASANLPRQRVAIILPNHSLADIDFRAGQQTTRNVFVPLAGLQDALQQPNKVNAAVAVSSKEGGRLSLSEAQLLCDQINARILPTLTDFGLKVTRQTRLFPDESIGETSADTSAITDDKPTDAASANQNDTQSAASPPEKVFDYYQVTSEQLIIDDLSQRLLMQAFQSLQPQRAISYLINEIQVISPEGVELSPKVTYSIAVGLENWETAFNAKLDQELFRQQRPGTCGVNSWLAKRLGIEPGSILRVWFFKPETIEGREVETTQDFTVAGIVPVTEPSKGYVRNRPARFNRPPTAANDPDLTPVVPGITDEDSISNWDLPFKLTREIPKEDDDYWQDYRLTPKIFLRYSNAVRYFGSRFGNATAIRIDATNVQQAQLNEDALRQKAAEAMLHAKAALGLQLLPIRQLQLQAASGTTPFDGLFLALSFFVIVAALMLVALLFRLSIEQRANQWGVLLASGFSHGRVRSLLLRESFVVVLLGVLMGILLGLAYARVMIAGLETWWVGAVSGSFLNFHFTVRSLAIGCAVGAVASFVTILWSLRRLNRKAPLDLLRGRWDTASVGSDQQNKVALAIAGFLAFGAIGLLILGATQTGMAQAGSFFGCGMLLLASALVATAYMLKQQTHSRPRTARPGLWSIAWLALTRNPWRSVLTIGLLSVASFLIASMSIFQIAPNLQGSGGFELMAESSLPIYRDLGATRAREEVLSTADFNILRTATILSFRARLGEDASCNNLYKVAQPTVLGVPDSLAQQQITASEGRRFQWAAGNDSSESPWQTLGQVSSGAEDDPVPVVMDLNTAAWSLHQGASLNAITKVQFEDRVIHFRTVGLLSNSVMQGKLLISEYNFMRLFPDINGYRFFLIHDEEKDMHTLSTALENGWSDEGLDATSTQEALAKLLAVQNTYISAFQAIGALGLLLGTIGLAVVQVRSVLERRHELALMQAVGFSRSRIAQLLLCESIVLLAGGMVVGILAAVIAIVPFMLSANSQASVLEPLIMLAIVLAVGLLASFLAIVTALKQPILRNLQ